MVRNQGVLKQAKTEVFSTSMVPSTGMGRNFEKNADASGLLKDTNERKMHRTPLRCVPGIEITSVCFGQNLEISLQRKPNIPFAFDTRTEQAVRLCLAESVRISSPKN